MTAISDELIANYPVLAQLDTGGRELLAQARRIEVPAGTVLFRHGDRCEYFVMLVSGQIKVVARAASGREMVLYRIEQHGTCVLTTSCLLGDQRYPAEGVTETDSVAYLLPYSAFRRALECSGVLRDFVFDSYAQRLAGLISLVQAVSFDSIEQRIAAYLLQRAGEDLILCDSHQFIADELGTAREVVSRKLKGMAQRGWLEVGRGEIRLLDPSALQQL